MNNNTNFDSTSANSEKDFKLLSNSKYNSK